MPVVLTLCCKIKFECQLKSEIHSFPNFSTVQKVNLHFDRTEQIVFVFLVPMFLLREVTSQDLQPAGEGRETIHSTFTLQYITWQTSEETQTGK